MNNPEYITQKEAIAAMQGGGYKIAHIDFLQDEWIAELMDGELYDEKGQMLDSIDFWNERKSDRWQNYWQIVG